MSLSESDINILNKIADTVTRNVDSEEAVTDVLCILRKNLRCRGFFLVFQHSENHPLFDSKQKPYVWHDLSAEISDDTDQFIKQAIEATVTYRKLPDNLRQKRVNGFSVFELPIANNNLAFLLSVNSTEELSANALLPVVFSYLCLLLRNVDVSDVLVESRDAANQHMNEMAAIYEIGKATEESGVDSLLNLIVSKAASVMDAQACSLLISDHLGSLVIKASYGLSDDIVNQTRINIGEGIAGQVAITGQPVLIGDVGADPRFSKNIKPRLEISGSICVPLKDEDGAVYGVLNIRRHFPKPAFNEEDLKLFQVFGTHAAMAISNGELYSRLNSKINEMAAVSDVLRTVNSSMSLNIRLQAISEAIEKVVGFDRCCVYLLEESKSEFVAKTHYGYSDPDEIPERIPLKDSIFALAASEGIPIYTFNRPGDAQESIDSDIEYLVAPMMVKGSCIGAVVADNSVTHTNIADDQVVLLSTFVNQAGNAVENARLYEEMQEKYEELNVLYEHSLSISAAYGLQNISEALLQACTEAAKCTGAGVVLLDTLRGNAKLSTCSGDLAKISKDLDKALASPQGVQFVRSQRLPVVLNSGNDERETHPIGKVYDKRWPVNRRNIATLPLISEGTVIGTVLLSKDPKDAFRDSDITLLTIIAGHASTVIRNAYILEQNVSRKVLELTTLYDFSNRITSSGTLAEAFESILAILAGLVDFDEAFVYVVDRDRGVAIPRASTTRADGKTALQEESLSEQGIVSWVVNESKAIVSPDLPKDNRFGAFYKNILGVRSVMAIPLVVRDEVVAALVIHSENPQQYTEDNVRVLSIIASQGAAIFSELQVLNRLTSYTDNVLASIAAGVVTMDQDNNIITWNAAAERITGISEKEIVGKKRHEVLDLLPLSPEQANTITDAIEQVIQTRKTYYGYKLKFNKLEDEIPEPDIGRELYLNLSISPLKDKAGNNLGLVIIFEDITRELEMETKFHRMSELANIGQVAANIAHELRNPLSSIKGAAQFLKNEYNENDPIVEFLGIIVDEVNGLNDLTTEFLDFSRPLPINLTSIGLNELIIKNTLFINNAIQQYNIAFVSDLETDLPVIHADGDQIQRVLRNIIINAVQAMPEGGKLHIQTKSRPETVSLQISDTGAGISKEQLNKIFQPFFTTKTKGTGLGLSIVNKIVENHNGKVFVDSNIGEGTTVTITLPVSSEGHFAPDGEDSTLEQRVSKNMSEIKYWKF